MSYFWLITVPFIRNIFLVYTKPLKRVSHPTLLILYSTPIELSLCTRSASSVSSTTESVSALLWTDCAEIRLRFIHAFLCSVPQLFCFPYPFVHWESSSFFNFMEPKFFLIFRSPLRRLKSRSIILNVYCMKQKWFWRHLQEVTSTTSHHSIFPELERDRRKSLWREDQGLL